MKIIHSTSDAGFTLIELLVVISIIAILAGIALPVFGEVQVRGAQTKALSNAKQVGLACKVYAQDYNGDFPSYTNAEEKTGTPTTSNDTLQTLLPDYVPDKSVFGIPKSVYGKGAKTGGQGQETKLRAGENEWAYVLGLNDTSNARYPLLADGFATGSSGDPKYTAEESKPGGVWKGKKAVVIRVDSSGAVETCVKLKVPKSDNERNKNLFTEEANATPPWLSGTKVLNPVALQGGS